MPLPPRARLGSEAFDSPRVQVLHAGQVHERLRSPRTMSRFELRATVTGVSDQEMKVDDPRGMRF